MFSFFKKKPKFSVRVRSYEQPRYIAGMQTSTSKKTYRKDVTALQGSFNDKRENLQNRTNPSGTMVVFSPTQPDGTFTYFVGDLVDSTQQNDCFTILELPAGDYASIQINFKVANELSLAIAKAKKYFLLTWLPSSGYRVREGFESCELYDRRSKIALPSMELIFPLEK